jgi:glycosyltransferase involved in cell wall biosynthesis
VNIGLLIGRFPPDLIGGAELQVQQLATDLARRGHNVTVFTRRYSDRPYHQWQDGYLIRRRNEFPVPGLRMVWDTFPALWNIARRRPSPQVLLCYQTLNSGLIGIVAQLLLGIPAVVSIRGNREYRLRHSTSNRLLVPAIYRRARYLIVQSSRILDDLHTQLRLADHAALSDQLQPKIKVIPNGICIPHGIRSNGTKVVYVGRLIRNKGIADLLLAMKQLPGAEALIVGDGPDRARLESLAGEMPVTFVGQVPPSAVVDYLQQARLLVLPSHLGDGLPNVILEAMACGVPVVATRTAGIPDLVRHKETGFLFEPGDIQQMVSYIDRLLKDDRLWKSLSKHSPKVVQAYSWDVITPQIEELLRAAVISPVE